MSQSRTVSLFRNGRNQAICIPAEFTLPGDQAVIHREGEMLIVEPVRRYGLPALVSTWAPQGEDFPALSDTPVLTPRPPAVPAPRRGR